jgi:uroporphyrinogen decarboxylase
MRPDIGEFKRVLHREKAGYIPLAELGVHPEVKARFLGRPILSLADEIEFWYRAGYDYVKLQPGVDFTSGASRPPDKVTHSPEGILLRNWAEERSGVITTAEELRQYRFPRPEQFDYSLFDLAPSLLPPGMGIIGQYGDIFTLTWEMMGFESFSLALFENPALVDKLNATIGSLVLPMFEYFAQSEAVDVLWYSDDIAYTEGLMVSPEVLHRYFFPWLKRIGDLARASGKPLIYHSDGVLYSVFDEIIACGVDAIHPLEPKAMALGEVKRRYGDRLCLIGHVDVDLLARGTPEEVRSQVRQNIEIAGQNGGYIVGSGNSIPEYVRLENYRAMLEAAREFGE